MSDIRYVPKVPKAKIIDIEERTTEFDKGIGIIRNGEDNLYAERIERLINNSVTSKKGSNIMASYLVGKGFGEEANKLKVNNKGLSLFRFLAIAGKNVSRQRGCFIGVDYNANFDIAGYKVLPYTDCRLGEKDDNEYNGKILVSKDWTKVRKKTDLRKNFISKVDVFNPDKKVVESQVLKAGGIDKYKGQILYFNLDDEYYYALSQIHEVMKDCDSESQASVFKNRSLRKGFFGKSMFITKPLSGNIDEYDTPEDYHLAVSEAESFRKTIEEFHGAENNGGSLVVELDNDGDSIDEALQHVRLESDVDDELFRYTEESVFNNILMAFNNLPKEMVRSDSSLFANGGESLRVMKETYFQNTSIERMMLVEMVVDLAERLPNIENLEYVPLIEEQKQEENDTTD